ncbi:MAG: serine hydrolase [Gaiellaceae bacterium]
MQAFTARERPDLMERAPTLAVTRPPRVTVCSLALVVAVALPCLAGGAAAGEIRSPRAWEAFFGSVAAPAPAGATHAELFAGDRLVLSRPVAHGRVSFRLPLRPGSYDLRVRFERDGRLVRRDESRAVWLLPRSARAATRERSRDPELSTALRTLGRGFDGYAAFWVHDLVTGRTAAWNSDTSFPAASTVKLAVLIAALERFGPRPERTSAWRDIRDLATWSSNLASNRLLIRLGGSEAGGSRIAQRVLDRIGARSSTFTGNYRLGTAAAADTPRPLPILTYRRTTAHDLGRILLELHAAALGNGLSRRRTGLSRHEARIALGLLLSSGGSGDNLGLLRSAFGPSVPMAQKQGWTESVRHTAAIVYGAGGPRIVVVLTYRAKIDPAGSLALGSRLVRTLGQ